eukprot:jgi/Pico_ML_1/51888/g19.t1
MRTSQARAMSTSMASFSQRPLDARRGRRTSTRSRTQHQVRASSYRPRAPSAAAAARATTSAKPKDGAKLGASERAADASGCPRGGSWHVHKFGGTCVGSPERILAAADLVRQQLVEENPGQNRVLMVVSAMGTDPKTGVKTTDALLKAVELAAKQDPASADALEEVRQKHIQSATELLGPGEALDTFLKVLDRDCEDLSAMLKAIRISGSATDAFSDFVVGHGELWSAQMMCAALRMKGAKALWMDARDVLVVVPTADNNSVDIKYRLSNENLDRWFDQRGVEEDTIIVATGFVARDPSGAPTTLKRNGSDYSATIMGALLLAGSITIWTDVNGVYSADPRKVSEAVSLHQLSYHEAWELSYFGANVLHPRTTLPAMKYNIPVIIRNFFDLENPGTQITNFQTEEMDCRKAGQAAVKGFATIDDVAVMSVEGTGMVGVPGTASAIFSTLRDANINVVMISQASSEHSVCFCVKGADAPIAKQALAKKFESALASGRISKVEVIPDCTILAAVGQGMCARRGVAETLFSALANAGINIKAIAQGSIGAGLPIIATLKGLLETGDKVNKVEGIFSGTLSYLFNTMKPDLELSDIPVESLVPEPLRSIEGVDEFMAKLPEYDGEMEIKMSELTGSDNIISFTTARYKAQPLIVRGPGAGAEVTAAGVFSDLLRLAAHLGAPS